MKKFKLSTLAAAVMPVLILAACGGDGNTRPTPRPRAFHRIEIPAAEYDTLTVADGVTLVTNSSARTLEKRPDGPSTWVDIVYPTLGNATIYCSVTPVTPATATEVIDNRLERIALNSGGYSSDLLEFSTPTGYDCRILVTGAGTATPVQFIGISEREVVSGVLMVQVADGFQPDSLAPVVDCVTRDVEMLLRSL
ncbi:MAG: hypothetical protein K2H98_07020 [Duncaniella sp.]|nr:hypothetical protein [Duncaniella sp.]